MNEFLDREIKVLVDQYPEVGRILEKYGVEFAACNAGSCLLKDVVGIHGLGPEAKREMMAAIARVIYPGTNREAPAQDARSATVATGSALDSPPMRMLVAEHAYVKRWSALIPRIVQKLDLHSEQDRKLVRRGVAFIRSYADKYHHAKEEEILFKYFEEKHDVVNVMRAEHETARAHVHDVVAAVDRRDTAAVREHLLAYADLLEEHIRKENEILYPWIERQLSERNIGKIFALFLKVDRAFGDLPRKQQEFIENLERQLETEPVEARL